MPKQIEMWPKKVYICPECGSMSSTERFCALHKDQQMRDRGEAKAVMLFDTTRMLYDALTEISPGVEHPKARLAMRRYERETA